METISIRYLACLLLALAFYRLSSAFAKGALELEATIDGHEILYSGDFPYIVEKDLAPWLVATVVETPNNLDGYPVAAIGFNAFMEGVFNDITIPEGFICIEDSFAGDYYIDAVTILESVTYIQEDTFSGVGDVFGRFLLRLV